MTNRNKGIALLSILTLGVTTAFHCAFIKNSGDLSGFAQNKQYQLSLSRSVNSDELISQTTTFFTEDNNPINFIFDSSKAEINPNGIINLLEDGYFYNDTSITGITNINIVLSGGLLELKYGNYKSSLILGTETLDTSGENNVLFDIELSTPSNFFKLSVLEGPVLIKELSLEYSCLNDAIPIPKLKTAVFADIQLCAKESGVGYAVNAANTTNAYIALKNHLKLCKEENVDVILMNGDIVNNAIEKYYELYEETLIDVYGNDESLYPEIIFNMGNHEWWPLNSASLDPDAVSLFKKYARIGDVTRQTSVRYSLDAEEILPTYYKVIKGTPFLVISGEDANGLVGNTMRDEIAGWLNEISNLESVRNGGPIYVLYHYALHTTLTHGNGALANSTVLENLLSSYPQAVVFTGDTHYSGVNERAINQVDNTVINIGSSSYSRMDKMSATMAGNEHFYNLKDSGGQVEDIVIGSSAYKMQFTPTIHIMETMDDESTVINRYFSTDDETSPTHINNSWYLPSFINESKFEYTNDRFENLTYSRSLYGADGVSWPNNAEVHFGVDNNKMIVIFPDTNEYHYTEHYKIDVIGNTTKTYDVAGNYYRYEPTRENNYFVLEDLPKGDIYTVGVTAYDYFDNPSLNYLTSNVNESIYPDEIDNAFTNTYSEFTSRMVFDDLTPGSKSSIEYFYQGTKQSEIALNVLIYDINGGNPSVSDLISIGNTEDCEVIVKTKVKNLTEDTLNFSLTLYDKNESYIGNAPTLTRKTVTSNSGWTSLEWNLTDLFPSVVGRSGLTFAQIRVTSSGADEDGYSMHLLIDDEDIEAGNHVVLPDSPSRNTLEMCDILKSDTKCGSGDISYSEVYGNSSHTSRLFTYGSASGFSNTSSNTYRAFAEFDVAANLGEENGINPKACTLSFDVKFSSEIVNSDDTRVLTSFTLETNNYASIAYLSLSSADGDGWIHVSINLANASGVTASDNLSKIRFGFYGIYNGNKSTAYIILDNISLVTNL